MISTPQRQTGKNTEYRENLCNKLKRKSVRCDGEGSNPNDLYKTECPFYTNKGKRSSCHIQLLEKAEIISDHEKVANVMNNYFVNVADIIGRPVN